MKSKSTLPVEEFPGRVHCYMCTHKVEATVLKQGVLTQTKPGQSCRRCAASLDSSYVVEVMTELVAA
jgi:hypothetical protein